MLDGRGRGGRHRQRARVGVADVLGGEDHHPPHDEARVLSALQHHREVVQRGVRVRAAGRLDPGRGVVVVLVAGLVVEHRTALQRVLGASQRHSRLAELGCRLDRELERVQGGARVAFATRREEVDRLGSDGRPVRRRPAQHVGELRRAEGLQRVDAQPREQRAVDLERGVLGGRTDQRHQALLDGREQGVLLRLVEAVDLVEEQDRGRAAARAAASRPLDHRANLGAPGGDRAELLEGGSRACRDDPRERRLPRARRSVQEHRVRPPLVDRGAKRRALREQVGLPDEPLQRARPGPRRERLIRCRNRRRRRVGARALVGVFVEQGIHLSEYVRVGRAGSPSFAEGGLRAPSNL